MGGAVSLPKILKQSTPDNHLPTLLKPHAYKEDVALARRQSSGSIAYNFSFKDAVPNFSFDGIFPQSSMSRCHEFLSKCDISTLSNNKSARSAFLSYLHNMAPRSLDIVLSITKDNDTRSAVGLEAALRVVTKRFILFVETTYYLEWTKELLRIDVDVNSADAKQMFEKFLTPQQSIDVPVLSDASFHLNDNEWFFSLVAIAEDLPATVILSLADEGRSYPIVYANKHAGTRAELIGKPNSLFLDTALDIQESIRSGIPVVFSTTDSICGFPLEVLSKPIYDSSPRFRFLISAHLHSALPAEDMKIMHLFMICIPTIIFGDRQ